MAGEESHLQERLRFSTVVAILSGVYDGKRERGRSDADAPTKPNGREEIGSRGGDIISFRSIFPVRPTSVQEFATVATIASTC